eukprot:10321722-Lingulodinium_polyedra.AAC.1
MDHQLLLPLVHWSRIAPKQLQGAGLPLEARSLKCHSGSCCHGLRLGQRRREEHQVVGPEGMRQRNAAVEAEAHAVRRPLPDQGVEVPAEQRVQEQRPLHAPRARALADAEDVRRRSVAQDPLGLHAHHLLHHRSDLTRRFGQQHRGLEDPLVLHGVEG